MKNKNKSITVYFHNDIDLFNELMKMNKFYRSQFIRDSIRESLFGTKKIAYKQKEECEPQLEDKNTTNITVADNTDKKVYEDNNDPMSIF